MVWYVYVSVSILAVPIIFHVSFGDEAQNHSNLEGTSVNIFYDGYAQTEKQIPLLAWGFDQLQSLLNSFEEIRNNTNTDACNSCAVAFQYFILGSRLHLSREFLKQIGVSACKLFNIQSEQVCEETIELNMDAFLYIFHENPDLNEQKICSIVLQNHDCFKEYRSQWSVHIPSHSSSSRNNRSDNQINNNFHRVLHLTDIHVDLLYEPGSNAVCDEPLCCQKDQISISDPSSVAGKWGDYRNCDMPYHSLLNMLEQIIEHNKELDPGFSYVYFTGDIISHRMWDTSKDKNIQLIKQIYKLFKGTFGSIPVFPVLGNHEPHPVNAFSPPYTTNPKVSTQWLFDLIAEEWGHWLPEETQETIRYGGYYTVVVKPGFRIIALNSNICFIYNWWLLHNDNDPFYQLHWLIMVLSEAEAKNEAIHILSHIPPGEDTCLQEWTRQYQRIIQRCPLSFNSLLFSTLYICIYRFSNIITGQFNGHTHFDEFRVFYNNSDLLQPINVAYNGGSFTTFRDLNPNYRFYNIHSETFEVLDIENWIFNMKEANANVNTTPNWYKLYSFKDAYGLQSLKPKDIGDLVYKMANNVSLLQLYYRFKVRDAEPSMLKGCDDDCLKENLCNIVTTAVDDKTLCNELLSLLTVGKSVLS